jgi:hypothetical protein
MLGESFRVRVRSDTLILLLSEQYSLERLEWHTVATDFTTPHAPYLYSCQVVHACVGESAASSFHN